MQANETALLHKRLGTKSGTCTQSDSSSHFGSVVPRRCTHQHPNKHIRRSGCLQTIRPRNPSEYRNKGATLEHTREHFWKRSCAPIIHALWPELSGLSARQAERTVRAIVALRLSTQASELSELSGLSVHSGMGVEICLVIVTVCSCGVRYARHFSRSQDIAEPCRGRLPTAARWASRSRCQRGGGG